MFRVFRVLVFSFGVDHVDPPAGWPSLPRWGLGTVGSGKLVVVSADAANSRGGFGDEKGLERWIFTTTSWW